MDRPRPKALLVAGTASVLAGTLAVGAGGWLAVQLATNPCTSCYDGLWRGMDWSLVLVGLLTAAVGGRFLAVGSSNGWAMLLLLDPLLAAPAALLWLPAKWELPGRLLGFGVVAFAALGWLALLLRSTRRALQGP